VVRDHAIGRVYLPLDDLQRFGCSVEDIATRRFTPSFAALLRFEVERTRSLFHQGLPLVPLMPADLQADIELFARGGLAILGKIEQSNYNVLTSRPALSRWDKGSLLLSVAWRRLQAWLPGW
jgi:phytoene/squalene synthetase